ncbi:bromodomain-containing protein [Desertifilum sp. FACHB-1129]|uniref:Bromodomain-containing protein n=1 Tax=Desertifilum tharense IPPAS B-1220 TaxID=1781255 RepID=A0A1E5QDA6_9CYAN|nr:MULTISPECIES: bromodomain-containing protein [Desertifilum]MDA0213692.1 bromodomain-containing protein [Cyanobacteria bacterium FC1]MDI9639860.1 bromodomain-containing protein [Geitlerinema splendidum]MBD2311302.1 bromodomain-containing protein [Desertifilum sp. FACHB-1129]MBD2321548.1 bromodomain-containing protein [Desertifilum sp. FACHB-866]MBD2331675.1 bromodomain-containing protein [Desertifilum sp. FACHB-868]
MDFRYKWKRGRTPTPDEAMRDSALLDESQFDSKQDWEMAEQDARRHLGLPLQTVDEKRSVLPKAVPDKADMTKP